ncbi:MAG TPA: hypothetical protein PLD05_01615 [Thermogutta sp.]|nr:hypothetical protein [Thermogutta sp.]
MPRLPAAFGVILTAALCIGWAILRYPQVNQQVWEMVQAGRQPSADGSSGFHRLGLAIPANMAVAQAEQRSTANPTTVDRASPAATEHEDVEAGFAMVPITGYVGANQAKPKDEKGPAQQSHLENVQVTLAVPPQMAILSQPNDDRFSGHDESETPDPSPGQTESDGTGRDMMNPRAEVPSTPSLEEEPTERLPVPRSREESAPSVGETNVTAGDFTGPGNSAQPTETVKVSSVSPSEMATDSGSHDDYVDPPLVPVIRNSSATGLAASLSETGGFEVVAPHEAVARLAPSPPVTLPSDLPLVNIYRNRWFAAEKPQRLPPVEEASQDSDASAGMERYWDGAPSIPLYPSTGR